MKIEVVPYNSLWPAQFESERSALLAGLGNIIDHVHHIGSTAIRGLSAKPVIDIIIEVQSFALLDRATSKLETMGYEAMGEFGIAGRRYFRKGGVYRTHQIHAIRTGDVHVMRHLAFRDYLAAHPSVMEDYGLLKMKLAADCNDDLDEYCNGKDPFIKTHESRALEWKRRLTGDCR